MYNILILHQPVWVDKLFKFKPPIQLWALLDWHGGKLTFVIMGRMVLTNWAQSRAPGVYIDTGAGSRPELSIWSNVDTSTWGNHRDTAATYRGDAHTHHRR